MTDVEERTRRGRDVLTTLGGSAEAAEGMVDHLEAQGALGQFAVRTGAGEIWSRDALSRRDRSLVVIAMLTALGRELELRQHVAGGLNHGLGRDEVDEIMVQLSAYAGLPCAFAGARIVGEVFAGLDGSEQRKTPPAAAEAKTPAQRREDGKDVLRTLIGLPEGADVGGAADATIAQLGDMGALVLDFAFGDVWARPQLSRRDRSLVVVSVLTALNLTHELEIHLGAALNHGVTRHELEELMITAVPYGGFPRAIDGMHLVTKVVTARDAS